VLALQLNYSWFLFMMRPKHDSSIPAAEQPAAAVSAAGQSAASGALQQLLLQAPTQAETLQSLRCWTKLLLLEVCEVFVQLHLRRLQQRAAVCKVTILQQ
jgi:hypothetical protein